MLLYVYTFDPNFILIRQKWPTNYPVFNCNLHAKIISTRFFVAMWLCCNYYRYNIKGLTNNPWRQHLKYENVALKYHETAYFRVIFYDVNKKNSINYILHWIAKQSKISFQYAILGASTRHSWSPGYNNLLVTPIIAWFRPLSMRRRGRRISWKKFIARGAPPVPSAQIRRICTWYRFVFGGSKS